MLFKNFFILASLAALAHAKVNLHSLKQCGKVCCTTYLPTIFYFQKQSKNLKNFNDLKKNLNFPRRNSDDDEPAEGRRGGGAASGFQNFNFAPS